MVAEKNITGAEVADPHSSLDRTENEKAAAIYNDNSDISSGGGEYDDLPDPDAGKSDEERARLVCSSLLCALHWFLYTDRLQDKALVWKMDLWLIPWLSLLYLLS